MPRLRVKKKYPAYTRAWRCLEKSLPDLYQFEKDTSLPLPRTSNRIENFMGVLEQRLKTFRGIKTPETLIRIVTSFIVIKGKKSTKK